MTNGLDHEYDFFAPPPPQNEFWPSDLQSQISLVDPSWRALIGEWYYNGPGREMNHLLVGERACSATRTSVSGAEMRYIYPKWPLKALNMTSLKDTKIVILGDEPSAVGNIADGLAFSSAIPQSYSNAVKAIRDELARDLGIMDYGLSSFEHWASRGVLLLNCTLTVSSHAPKSHVGIGWEQLTDQVIDMVALDSRPRVFLLWGKVAQSKAERIEGLSGRHLVLIADAPNSSVRTNSFVGCGHFRKAMEFLARHGESIDWIRSNPARTHFDAHHEAILERGRRLSG